MIRVSVPGSLRYRDLVCRVVASSCKLVEDTLQDAGQALDGFQAGVVSAVGEAFNNLAIHGYAGRPTGSVDIEIDATNEKITIRMSDFGKTFDPESVPQPDFEGLPESGMGLYIIRSFMDKIGYQAGNPPDVPNVLVLEKSILSGHLAETRDAGTGGDSGL